MNQCKNCHAEVSQHYCPNCGTPVALKRIDGHYILHELEHMIHFEKGLLYTIKELLLRPGQSVKHFLVENRNRLVKPIVFLLIASLLYTLVSHYFHVEDGYVAYKEGKPTATGQIFKWIQDHYGYANIIMGVFIAWWTKIFFRKYQYNYFEILILLCFVMGMAMLIFAFFSALEGLLHVPMMQVSSLLGIGYCTWAIAQFFDKGKAISYIKAFAAYMLGMIAFSLAAVAIGMVVDMVRG